MKNSLPLLLLSTAALGLACASNPGAESDAGTGGAVGSGGAAAASGGAISATGGAATESGGGTGGDASSGGAPGAGGAASGGASNGDGTTDADGCPITLEGFATLASNGQNGTYGGRDGETVTVSTEAELEEYATAEEPYVIRVAGTITLSPKGKEIRVASNKTIVGVGTTGEISEGGFFLGTGVHNVIFRNLRIGNTFLASDPGGDTQDWDGIQMDTAHHVWIDHCDFHHIGDGMIDSRRDTTNLTVSWTILRDHNKAFGIGWTENVTAEITIHHNWFRDLQQRNPSADNILRAHLYNNFLERLSSYGNYARGGTNMVLENSVFADVNNPHYYDTGSLVAIGNVYRDTTGQTESSGSTYSFFDPNDLYEYELHPASEVEALVEKCAGPRPTLGL